MDAAMNFWTQQEIAQIGNENPNPNITYTTRANVEPLFAKIAALEARHAAAEKVIEAADTLRKSTENWGGPHICDNFPSQFENGLRKREATYDAARREWEELAKEVERG